MENKSTVTFWSGVNTVTGANFMLEHKGKKILIDCGLTQGTYDADKINSAPFKYSPVEVDALFVTHAHMDHIGKIPKLVKEGFRGDIYSTEETAIIARIMLEDALKVNLGNTDSVNFFTEDDLNKALSLWKIIKYHQDFKFDENIKVLVRDAGHILGSSMFTFDLKGEGGDSKRILFTGDLGHSPSVLLRNVEEVNDVNYIVMESVYGDRNHESKEEKERQFIEVIEKTIREKRTLLIPAFSLERTQTILHELDNLVEEKRIGNIDVYLDSPLATRLTSIYRSYTENMNEKIREELKTDRDIFEFPRLKVSYNSFDSREIKNKPSPKIIIAGSGMSMGGRILGHEAHFLPQEKTTILFVGYQAPGTLGRQIKDGAKKVIIDDQEISVKAEVVSIEGYSSHMDSDHLLGFIEKAAEGPLQEVFVVLGEPRASSYLAQRINDYTGIKATCPEIDKSYSI